MCYLFNVQPRKDMHNLCRSIPEFRLVVKVAFADIFALFIKRLCFPHNKSLKMCIHFSVKWSASPYGRIRNGQKNIIKCQCHKINGGTHCLHEIGYLNRNFVGASVWITVTAVIAAKRAAVSGILGLEYTCAPRTDNEFRIVVRLKLRRGSAAQHNTQNHHTVKPLYYFCALFVTFVPPLHFFSRVHVDCS